MLIHKKKIPLNSVLILPIFDTKLASRFENAKRTISKRGRIQIFDPKFRRNVDLFFFVFGGTQASTTEKRALSLSAGLSRHSVLHRVQPVHLAVVDKNTRRVRVTIKRLLLQLTSLWQLSLPPVQ